MSGGHSEQNRSKFEEPNDFNQVITCKDLDTLENSEFHTSLDSGDKFDFKAVSNTEELELHKMIEDDSGINNTQGKNDGNLLSSSVKSSNELSMTNIKRDSPIGNDDDSKFSELNFSYPSGSDSLEKSRKSPELPTHSSDSFIKSLSPVDRAEEDMELVDDVVKPSSRQISRENSASDLRNESRDILRGSRPPSIGADFVLKSAQGPLKHSQSVDSLYSRSQSSPRAPESDRFTPDNLRHVDSVKVDSPRQEYTNEQVIERVRSSASPALVPQTTPTKERSSQVFGSVPSSPRGTTSRDLSGDNYTRKGKIQENGEMVAVDNLGGRPPSHPSSRTGSLYLSRAQSLNSVTSDQELAQLFEHSRTSSPGSQPQSRNSVDSNIMKGIDRPHAPIMTSQNQVQSSSLDVHSLKNYSSNDMERLRDTQSRSSAISRASTNVSSRTATPVPTDNGNKEFNTDRIKELEASVTNLRKLLSSREAEVHSLTSQLNDMKDINRSMREELEHRGRRHTPVSGVHESLEYKQLQSEKEILASEVVTLRDELQRINKRRATENGHKLGGSELTDYSPNSAAVLHRKMVDLEAHVRDLQEVNETTNSSLMQAEKKLKVLQNENKELKSRAHSYNDTQAKGDHDIRVELRTLKEDIRNLKERNYQLTEDNMRLQESQRNSSKDTSSHSSSVGSRIANYVSENTDAKKTSSSYATTTSYRYEPASVAQDTSERRRTISAPSKKANNEDLTPREIKHSVQHHSQRNTEPQHRHYQNSSDYYLHNYLQKNSLAGSKPIESLRKESQHPDRSTPDGEVSEKLHLDKYAKLLPSYEKRSYEFKSGEGESYLDKHSSYKPRPSREMMDYWMREKTDIRDKGDKYRHLKDGQLDSNSKLNSSDRLPLSGPAISSRDIYYNVQQRRAGHWSQQDNKYLTGNLDYPRYHPSRTSASTLGDDSDTATDILIRQDINTKGLTHRRSSLGSDDSPSSFSDVEDSADILLRRRSKSTDTLAGTSRQSLTLHRSESASRPLNSTEQAARSAGFRSVIPAPLVTQHNKTEVSSKSATSLLNSSLTQGMRPFAPRSPADIRTDDVVKFSRLGGKLTQGEVKFVGHLPGRSEAYLGVELDKDEGKHDGTFEGIRYFKCKPNKGVFVAFNKVVMAWAP